MEALLVQYLVLKRPMISKQSKYMRKLWICNRSRVEAFVFQRGFCTLVYQSLSLISKILPSSAGYMKTFDVMSITCCSNESGR